MPQLQIRGLNKPPIFDGTPGFGGGQESYLRPSLLNANQCERLVNVDITRTEDATTRRGTDQLQTGETAGSPVLGMAYFDTPAIEKLVRVKNTGTVKVQQHDGTPASVWQDVPGWTPANKNCSVVQGNNKLYFGNGVDNLRSWDGTTFTDMGTGYPNPPLYAFLLYATNRLIGWGDPANPDTIGFSQILGEGVWGGAQTLRIGAGDGDEIKCVMFWTTTLLAVFKRSSTYIVNIDPSVTVANFTVQMVSRTIGCTSPRGACKVGADIWFFSDTGVRSLQRVLNGEDSEISPAISYAMSDVVDTINRDPVALGNVCCAFYRDRYFLAFPDGINTQPNVLMPARVMDDGAHWMGTWTGWNPTLFVRSYIGGNERLNIGRGDGLVWRWRDFTPEKDEIGVDYQDIGTDFPTSILTRRHSFQDPDAWKQGFTAELEFNFSSAFVKVYAVPDAITGTDPIIQASSAIGFLVFPVTFPIVFPAIGVKRAEGTLMHTNRFRELAFLITSTSGKMALRKVTASAFYQSLQVYSR